MKTIYFIIIFITITYYSFSQTKYILPCDAQLLMASLDTAMKCVGVTEETGRNDGKEIESYLHSVERKKGDAYCAAGQYYCFYVSAIALNMPITEIPIKRTGIANEVFEDAKKRGRRVKYNAKKHDLIVWRRNGTPFGHIERIVESNKAGWVLTITFNTSQYFIGKGRVEGVFIKRRNIYHALGKMRVRGIVGFYIK